MLASKSDPVGGATAVAGVSEEERSKDSRCSITESTLFLIRAMCWSVEQDAVAQGLEVNEVVIVYRIEARVISGDELEGFTRPHRAVDHL